MKKWYCFLIKLCGLLGLLAAFCIIVIGVYEGDYTRVCGGLLFAIFFKLDRINESINKAVDSADLLVKMAAECRSKGG